MPPSDLKSEEDIDTQFLLPDAEKLHKGNFHTLRKIGKKRCVPSDTLAGA